VIQETFQVAIGSGAAPFNILNSTQFNPIPSDGVLDVWACLDPLGSPSSADEPPTVSISLGGNTPITPVQPSSINTNQFGVVGGPNTEATRVSDPQAVVRGTNAQVILAGGNENYVAYIKVKFRSLAEYQQGIGEAA